MKILTFLLLCFCSSIAFSQVVGGSYEKLEKLYTQGKYESCLFKADNYTLKESSSRDAEPYLYMAMCFFQLSKSEDELIREDYADGLKQAIKYAAKFVKKDKTGELYDSNIDFINELRDEQKKQIKDELNNSNFRKASSAAKLYSRLNRNEDFTITYFIGICEILSNNVSQGSRNMDLSKEKISSLLTSGPIKIDSKIKPIIIDGFLKYTEHLVNENKLQEAYDNLDFGLKLFPNDGYLKVQYNLIKKTISDQGNNATKKIE